MIRSSLRNLYRLWFTGLLFILAIIGYFLYSILWMKRAIQTNSHPGKLVIGGLLSAILAAAVYYFLLPIGACKEDVGITIHRGTPIAAIADSLAAHKVVTSARVLLDWLVITHLDRKIKAGIFVFKKGEGAIRASHKLLFAAPLEKMVTIPEGLTVEQIASRVNLVMPIDTTEFVSLCSDSRLVKELGIDAPSLEGYLFPDSYMIPEQSKPVDIIRLMTARFAKEYKLIKVSDEIAGKFSMRAIVTMASIVEKEAVLEDERARIAGVFYNRLKIGYPLGADPTVRYVTKKFNGPLLETDLAIESPYNTRKHQGLPPGPICCPGLASIQAAAAPAHTGELYFVAKWDGSGAHDFSLTNEEHVRKKIRIRRENELRKRSLGIRGKT